jgi:CHAD domain-containing protein
MYRTLRNLRQHFEGQLAAGALSHVRRKLRRACGKAMKRFARENEVKEVNRILRRAAKKLEHLKLSSKGWRVLYPGVKKAYSAGQYAYRTVLKDPSPENFHKWRKHAKALWYQVSLLEPLWPEQMEAMESELETLGEHLGDYHDLAVLRQTTGKKSDDSGHQRELETLNGLIDERQREVLAEAMPLGARFYAEKSSGFCERLAGYWQIWRGEKGHGIKSAGTSS